MTEMGEHWTPTKPVTPAATEAKTLLLKLDRKEEAYNEISKWVNQITRIHYLLGLLAALDLTVVALGLTTANGERVGNSEDSDGGNSEDTSEHVG